MLKKPPLPKGRGTTEGGGGIRRPYFLRQESIPQSATLTAPFTQGSLKGAFERSTVMNFTIWFVIAIAIIVPVATFIFHNKE